jgi:hypothetical protein
MRSGLPTCKVQAARKRLHCALCGSTAQVERHHVGGQFHIAWITVPLCRIHHGRMTEMLRLSGVEMGYTSDPQERLQRVRRAILVFNWMILELEQQNSKKKINVRKP